MKVKVEYIIDIISTSSDENGFLARINELDCYGDGETEIEAIEDVICADGIERFVTEWMECIMYVVNNEKVYTGKLKQEVDIGLIKSDLSKLRLYKRYSNYLDYNSFMLTLESEPIKDYSCDELKDYNKLDKRFFHCLYREDVISAVKCMEELFDSNIYKVKIDV